MQDRSNHKLEIRLAKREDLAAIAALHAEDDKGGHGDSSHPEALSDYVDAFEVISRSPNTDLYVAALAGDVVGTFQLTWMRVMMGRGALNLDIEAVRIANRLQGRGYGQVMMRFAIDLARKRGCRGVKLVSNAKRTDAHAFYEKVGLTASHIGFKMRL